MALSSRPYPEDYEEVSSCLSGRASPEVDDLAPFRSISNPPDCEDLCTHRLLRKKKIPCALISPESSNSSIPSVPQTPQATSPPVPSPQSLIPVGNEEILQSLSPDQIVKPIGDNSRIRCILYKQEGAFSSKFLLYVEGSGQFVMAAKRTARSPSAYIISKSQDDISNKKGNCLAKLKSNFLGTQFLLYTPKMTKSKGSKTESGRPLREIAAITYKASLLGPKATRKMTVSVPDVEKIDTEWCVKPRTVSST